MADENSFVQTIRIKADTSDADRAVSALERRLASISRGANLKVPGGLSSGLSGMASGTAGRAGTGSALVLKEQRHAAKAASTLATSLDSAARAVSLFSSRISASSAAVRSAGATAGTVPAMAANAAQTGKNGGFIGMGRFVPGIVAGALSVGAVKGFVGNSVAAYDTQRRAELQLRQVMSNAGMGAADFDAVKAHAGELQKRTMYGDEAMIAGAGELATYVKDPEQMKRMMSLLADYAAGMTGGGEVSSRQMVDLATGLGKAIDGVYDSLRMKGFDVSGLQELSRIEKDVEEHNSGAPVSDKRAAEIAESLRKYEELGGDLQSAKIDALKDALADWDGLAESFAGTDDGKIIQTKNAMGDIREEVGMRLQPVLARLAETISERMPQIEKIFNSLGKSAGNLIDTIADHAGAIGATVEALSRLLELLTKAPVAVGAFAVSLKAFGGMNGMAADAKGLAGAMDGLKGSLSGLAKAGMWGAIAWGIDQIVRAGGAAVDLYKQKLNERDTMQKFAASGAHQATLAAKRKKWQDAVKTAGDAYGKDPNATRMVGEAFAEYRTAAETIRDGGFSGVTAEDRKNLGWAEKMDPGVKAAATAAKKSQPVINIRQTNNISTSFDDFGRLVKENIRALAESALTIHAGSDIMKAATV